MGMKNPPGLSADGVTGVKPRGWTGSGAVALDSLLHERPRAEFYVLKDLISCFEQDSVTSAIYIIPSLKRVLHARGD